MLKLFKKKTTSVAENARVPQHIAFICDGNRRWAEMRGLPPLMGHQAGIANFENLVDWFFHSLIESFIHSFVGLSQKHF